MKHVNKFLWDEKKYFTSLLTPNLYFADSLEDFIESRDEVKATPFWRLNPLLAHTCPPGSAVIYIPGASLKRVDPDDDFAQAIVSDGINNLVARNDLAHWTVPRETFEEGAYSTIALVYYPSSNNTSLVMAVKDIRELSR